MLLNAYLVCIETLGYWLLCGAFVTEIDYRSADILINVDSQEPSWWVWVTEEMDNVEEWSGIDDESYLVIGEDHVVDGVANFMARCILSNPKALVYKCILMCIVICFICCIWCYLPCYNCRNCHQRNCRKVSSWSDHYISNSLPFIFP